MTDAQEPRPPHMPDEESKLFEQAARALVGERDEITAAQVAHWSQRFGLEMATAMLWRVVRRRNKALMNAVGSAVGSAAEPDGRAYRLLVVPGAFYKDHPHTGADGQMLIDIGRGMGWQAERVPVKSLGSLDENARIIREAVKKGDGRPTVVASLCKGSLDMRRALEGEGGEGAFKDVVGWVSLSGIVHGTPLVGWLRGIPWRVAGVHFLLWLRGYRFSVVDEMGVRDAGRPMELPMGMRLIHVVGFPLREHLKHQWAPKAYDRLAPLGPSDGGGLLLSDVLSFPGEVYPAWGVDHYLQPGWDVTGLMRTILLQATMSQTAAMPTPVIRSQT